MGKIYHKKLGLIEDTDQNRTLLVTKKKIKTVKNDTTKKRSVKQGSVDTNGISESSES